MDRSRFSGMVLGKQIPKLLTFSQTTTLEDNSACTWVCALTSHLFFLTTWLHPFSCATKRAKLHLELIRFSITFSKILSQEKGDKPEKYN